MYRIYTFLLIAVLLVVTVRGQENTCWWRMRLTTGSDEAASTDATISMTVDGGKPVTVHNTNADIRSGNEEGYVPFRRDQEDVLEFRGPCDAIESYYVHFDNDGTGIDPSWQLASVEADITFEANLNRTYKHNQVVWIEDGGVAIRLDAPAT